MGFRSDSNLGVENFRNLSMVDEGCTTNGSGCNGVAIPVNQMLMPNIDLLIPIFSGTKGENFSTYLANFEQIAIEFNWSAGAKLIWFRSRLAGDARKLYETLNQVEAVSFDTLTEQFTEFFSTTSSKYGATKLVKITAEPGETINSLKFRIQQEVKRYLKDTIDVTSETGQKTFDKLSFTQFMDAIDTKYKERIIREGVTSFTEAVQIALKEQTLMEELKKVSGNANGGMESCSQYNELLKRKDSEIEQLRESINALKLKTSIDKNSQRMPITCFFCNKKGHIKSECWRWKESLNQTNRGENWNNKVPRNGAHADKGNYKKFGNKNVQDKTQRNHFLG